MLGKVLRFKEDEPPETEGIRLSEDDLEKLHVLGSTTANRSPQSENFVDNYLP